jgi:hypothetical protein
VDATVVVVVDVDDVVVVTFGGVGVIVDVVDVVGDVVDGSVPSGEVVVGNSAWVVVVDASCGSDVVTSLVVVVGSIVVVVAGCVVVDVVAGCVVVVVVLVVVVVSGSVVVVGLLCIPLNDNSYRTFHTTPSRQALGSPQQVAARKRYRPASRSISMFDCKPSQSSFSTMSTPVTSL